MDAPGNRIIRFGTFEAHLPARELYRGGQRINLQEQPFRLLIALLERPGEVVTRDELRESLWKGTYVDFEDGLNTAVRKLRDALRDSAANPRFIETLPRRGYRFIAPVQVEGVPAAAPKPPRPAARRRSFAWVAIAATAILGSGWLVKDWLFPRESSWSLSPLVQLTRDSGLTTDPVVSRDGKLVAYASDRGDEDNLDIWVQHIPGGEARRLVEHSADDHQPDISPDGSEVIFRSERNGGGVYSVPVLGGTPRLIIKNAYVPRFSPDGSRIAYALGAFGAGGFGGQLHVYTPATGSTQILARHLYVGGPVAWSPDGKSIAFAASHADPPHHLWICSAETGIAAQMTISPIITDEVRTVSVAWLSDQLIFSAKQGDSTNLWSWRIAPGGRHLTGEPKRITFGSGSEGLPSVSAGGKLVFANHSYTADIWEAEIEKGATGAPMRRLTHGQALNYKPSLSADRSKLAYVSDRTGNFDIWIRELMTGNELALTRSQKAEDFASVSRDGSQIAFREGVNIYLISTSGGASRLLCEQCGRPDSWSPDGKLILWLAVGFEIADIRALDPATGAFSTLIGKDNQVTIAPDLSRDGKWLTFHTASDTPFKVTRKIYVAPYIGNPIRRSEWIAVTDGTALDREAKWSEDGSLVYFLSDRDGFRCIWARRLDPKTKQPAGSIHPVLHLHNSRLSLFHVPNTMNVSICPMGGKLIFAMGELRGNLWMTDLQGQR